MTAPMLTSITTWDGRRYRRPTTRSRWTWSRPRRERRALDDERYSRTTEPGILMLYQEHYNGEGISYRKEIIDFDDGTKVLITGGTGCDGHISHTQEFAWDGRRWVEESHRCYDQFAQAAGY